MFRKRLLCIVLSIISMICPILQSIPVLAMENSTINENISMHIQMMVKQKDSFGKSGSAEYVSGLQIDDCVLIDLEWLSKKLGLLVKIIEPSGQNTSVNKEMSYDIRKYQEVEKEAFSQNKTGKAIIIRKTENNCLQFILKVGSEKAFTYSPYLEEIKVDLGAEVTEQDGKIYVPFTMFLNLFDSHYVLDEENIINLYPCKTTVVDILHTRGLEQYYFNVIEDSGVNELGLGVGVGYNKFYRKIKALFQGVINLDVETLMKAMPNDKTEMAELLAEMLLTKSEDELDKVIDEVSIISEMDFYTVDFIKSQIEEGAEESLSETIRKWAEQREQNIKSTGFSSVDDCINFEAQAAKEIAKEKDIKTNIDNWCDATSIGAGLANIGVSAFVKYITLAGEINNTEIFYVDSIKNYIDKYDRLEEPWVEESIINTIRGKAKLYEKKEKSILKNKELMEEIFKDIGNTTASINLGEVADYSAKEISNIYPKFKARDFLKVWMYLEGVSIGWNVAEFWVNQGTKGSLKALDALEASIYAMLLQSDSENILKSINNYQNLEEYRKLEWVRLRSYYVTRQLILLFYQPQQLLHSEEYKIVETLIENESNELLDLMKVLAIGPIGISQEKLDEDSKIRVNVDGELLDWVKNNSVSIDDKDWENLLSQGSVFAEYVTNGITLDTICRYCIYHGQKLPIEHVESVDKDPLNDITPYVTYGTIAKIPIESLKWIAEVIFQVNDIDYSQSESAENVYYSGTGAAYYSYEDYYYYYVIDYLGWEDCIGYNIKNYDILDNGKIYAEVEIVTPYEIYSVYILCKLENYGNQKYWIYENISREPLEIGFSGKNISNEPEYKKAYADFIVANCGYGEVFDLIYLDEDEIPELIISPAEPCHADGLNIYSYYDGQVIELGGIGGSFGEFMYLEKGNYIISNYYGSGMNTYYQYQISDNLFKCIFWAEEYQLGDKTQYSFRSNGGDIVEITKRQYEEYVQDMLSPDLKSHKPNADKSPILTIIYGSLKSFSNG